MQQQQRAGQVMERKASLRGAPAPPGALRASSSGSGADVGLDELERLAKPTLTRRKDFMQEEEARKSPNRVLYFRRNADYDRLIEVCSRKISENPRNVRALLIRASSALKKGASRARVCVYVAPGAWGSEMGPLWVRLHVEAAAGAAAAAAA
jgi:hypothetical protein